VTGCAVLDLNSIPNPYDFANPVANQDLFIGRDDELSEIRYYLDHASKAPRPINIAILGTRASGKTSLLNVTEQEALKRGLMPVRIDLDENDAESQMSFFFKIFDALFSNACANGAYGGTHSRTFDTYLDITCSLTIPEDKTFCPFIFPIQYAKALASNNTHSAVPDFSFRQDLISILKEVKRPIVMLFDEGNVLSKSRVHLQKLRNIFMNTAGYMLIITGTPEMFPLMDEVFSPIIRQFRKINLRQFSDRKETKTLIRKYLEQVGIEPDAIFNFEKAPDVSDIHDLTGGRPYEIQLVCHTLFRRVQQKRADKMRLDLGAIDEVRQQLESSQNLVSRPMLQKVLSLDRENLRALAVFSMCSGHATFDQMWAIEHALGTGTWTREDLHGRFTQFKTDGIFSENEAGIVSFTGDDFDKIYTKYLALEKHTAVQFADFDLGLYTRVKLLTRVTRDLKLIPIAPFFSSRRQFNLITVAKALAGNNEKVCVLEINLSLGGSEIQSWYKRRSSEISQISEDSLSELASLQAKAVEVGGSISVRSIELLVPPLESMLDEVSKSTNQRLREMIAENHGTHMATSYFEDTNSSEAERHADAAFFLRGDLTAEGLNNLGYFYMSKGNWAKARQLFKASIDKHAGKEGELLPLYNLGILEGMSGDLQKSLESLSSVVRSSTFPKGRVQCLFVPRIEDKQIRFVETTGGLDLLETAREANRCLSAALTDGSPS
jgi:hypothetical protein